MEKKNPIEDIAVEWNGGIVRGFISVKDAERFIEKVCRKTAPRFKYSIYKYMRPVS